MISYLNLNGVRTFLSKLHDVFLTQADAANTYLTKTANAASATKDADGNTISTTYLKKADLNFVTTSNGVEIRNSSGVTTYTIPIMKE